MAIFRIHKTRNYTVMSNRHLNDRRLSYKAIGLLSKMLSLPDDWDFTVAGLVTLAKDGKESVTSAIKELEAAGYVRRTRLQDEKGRFAGYDYDVFEEPREVQPEAGEKDAQPLTGNPFPGNPSTGNPPQVITKPLSTKGPITKKEDREDKGDREGGSGERFRHDPQLFSLSAMETPKPYGLTKALVKSGYVSRDDIDITEYNDFLEELAFAHGYEPARRAVRYFIRKVGREERKGISDRLAYFKAAAIQGVERQEIEERLAIQREELAEEIARIRGEEGKA